MTRVGVRVQAEGVARAKALAGTSLAFREATVAVAR